MAQQLQTNPMLINAYTVMKSGRKVTKLIIEYSENYLHAGIDETSAVTILFIPRFDRPPLISPQVNAKY